MRLRTRALLVAPNLLGLFGVHAYDGTPSEQLGAAIGALGVLLALWTLEVSPIGRALPAPAARLLAAPGQAALTLYTLQILVLHVYRLCTPFGSDDHWWMLALLIVLGVGFAMGGQAALRSLARRVPASVMRCAVRSRGCSARCRTCSCHCLPISPRPQAGRTPSRPRPSDNEPEQFLHGAVSANDSPHHNPTCLGARRQSCWAPKVA